MRATRILFTCEKSSLVDRVSPGEFHPWADPKNAGSRRALAAPRRLPTRANQRAGFTPARRPPGTYGLTALHARSTVGRSYSLPSTLADLGLAWNSQETAPIRCTDVFGTMREFAGGSPERT